MRCRIILDSEALRHNYLTFKQLSAPSVAIPVVKSNAYGHGLKEVYTALSILNPPWFGVNYLTEAKELRALGYTGRILVVGPVSAEGVSLAAELDLDIFLVESHMLKAWFELKAKPRGHLKIDTGMSRQGFLPEEIPTYFAQFKAPENKDRLVGICSHFSNVEDVLAQSYALQQLATFERVSTMFSDAGFKLMPHIAASSSALIMPNARFALSRIGISLYGMWPSRTNQLSFLQSQGERIELKPVMKWKTEIAIVKKVHAGQFIGYGCTYKALRDMRIAVLPVGYYEGYPRLASNRGHVLINGEQCPIVGRICMNMMMVDTTHLDTVDVGTPVTLIGRDGDEVIEASTIGDWAETIHYEIVTQLNSAIPKVLS
ncbi:MAG: alanine racemase [Chitinophagaceae bacterium]|nr:alanine racemase [Oligoflexus sp.]